MSGTGNPIGSIVELVAPSPILGLRYSYPAPAPGTLSGEHQGLSQFEEQVWKVEVSESGDSAPTIPAEVTGRLATSQSHALFVQAMVSPRRLHYETPQGTVRGTAALVHHLLQVLPRGTILSILLPARVANDSADRALRIALDQDNRILWVVHFGNTFNLLAGGHSALQFLLVVVEVGGPSQNRVVRLVDLRSTPSSEWEQEVQHAASRGGGEVGRSIVLRGDPLGGESWDYHVFTGSFRRLKKDTESLDLCALGTLADMSLGLHSVADAAVVHETPEDGILPPGAVPVIQARDLQPDGAIAVGSRWVHENDLRKGQVLHEGDVLVPRILAAGTQRRRTLVSVVPPQFSGVAGSMVIRLRWRESVPRETRELLVAWLNSDRCWQVLEGVSSQTGNHIRVEISILRNLNVPDPTRSVMTALTKLAEIEEWYRNRAAAVRASRQAIFSADSYAAVVPVVLNVLQVERERVTAAEDTQRFDYRVRNHFPHPLALRREALSVAPEGQARLDLALECAEYLIHYLAVLGNAQLRIVEAKSKNPIPSSQLREGLKGSALRFDWGRSFSVLKEATAKTHKHRDPLSLPVPELKQLHALLDDESSRFTVAESALRLIRNDQSHLHRLPEPDLIAAAEVQVSHLDALLEGVSFLADLPLVYIHSCALDEFDGSRVALLDHLRGHSVIFRRERRVVSAELEQAAVGLLARDGGFHSLAPWLLHRTCSECKRREVFLFNRFEKGSATYVAMESGHAWSDTATSERVGRFLGLPHTVAPSA